MRRKLNAMALEFSGKNVLLVDDSIVRGTTSKEIVQMAKDVGAKSVFVASCAPPIRHSNVYGIDMPSRFELVAHNRTEREVATEIGADLVIFQKLDDLVESVRQWNRAITQFDCSVFTGEYVTGGVDAAYLDHLELLRADNVKAKLDGGPAMVDVRLNSSSGNADSLGHVNGKKLGNGAPVNGDDTVGLHNTWKQNI